MTQIVGRDGTWNYDGGQLRIVAGRDRGVHRLRQALGERAVPLQAIAIVEYEPGRRGGVLWARLREGADPFLAAVGTALPENADPYRLEVGRDATAAAERLAEQVRKDRLAEGVPDGPTDRYLLRGPKVPISAAGVDGTATFDGEKIRLGWNWATEGAKRRAGTQEFVLGDIDGVEWSPAGGGLAFGLLRVVVKGATSSLPPEHDPTCVQLQGGKKDTGDAALLAAAVAARLPHPSTTAQSRAAQSRAAQSRPAEPDPPGQAKETPGTERTAPSERTEAEPAEAEQVEQAERAGQAGQRAPAPPESPAAQASQPDPTDPDVVLRRLRELGDLHADGVLTDEEFATAKQALIDRL